MAHQIGMLTRVAYIFVLAYFLMRRVEHFQIRDLVQLGGGWIGSWLVFEWRGSLAMGRPVSEILIGWNIFKGYMWPYVLLAHLFSNLVGGMILRYRRPAGRIPGQGGTP